MKKIIVICIGLFLFITGCSSDNEESLIKKFDDKVNSSDAYIINGKMTINNGEDKYIYSLESSYLKEDNYKVVLINETNNHEQIILRNSSGVYVITPSLNKSFKFDSVWPENSSQGYLLSSLVKDINNDENKEFEETDDNYIIKSTVNYPNNSNLEYQKIYFDKNMVPKRVEVFDKNDNLNIEITFTNIDYKANLKEEDFNIENFIDKVDCEEECPEGESTCNICEIAEETSITLENIAYPLYIPENTSLTNTEEINNESINRVILTFSGDKDFVLIQENAKVTDDFEIIPINGNPTILNDTIGALSTNSMYFTKSNVDYYLLSNDLTNEEMVAIAESVSSDRSVISTK